MKGIKCVFWAILLAVVMCVCGCAGSDESGREKKSREKDKIQIGLCFDSFVIERWQRDRDVFVSMAKEMGAEVNVQNANGDAAEQKRQIDYFIKKKMDVIVIVCTDSNVIRPSVAKAKEEGIKVIAYDRQITDTDVDLYISFDNERVGELMAKGFVDAGLENGNVLMICGSPLDSNVPMVEAGFMRVMKEHGNTILDKFYAEGWKAEEASDYMYTHKRLVEKADAIMCGNDDLASRVVNALAERKLAGKKLVVGQDADLEACQRIVEGTQLMTVYKPIEKLAQSAAECAVKLAKGEELPSEELVQISNGRCKVPYLKIEPLSVTAANMDSVIVKSGFHLKEDVYLNVSAESCK